MQSIDLLRSYDIPDEIIDTWREKGIERFIPFQATAIKKHRLLDGENLLVSAPTSSGKTLLGEITTIRAALKSKKTLYLVPLKALAEEKFESFKSLGESSGLRVVISTRDRHDFDRDLSNGNFDIAVIVYEKFLYYLQSEAKFLYQFGLIVMDELQLISDPERGSLIELILSRYKQLPSGPQFLGLSAVLPYDSLFASWLGIPVLHETNRPIELRMGYLKGESFHYWSNENKAESIEEDFCFAGTDKQETLIETITKRADIGEQCLVFVPDRRSTRYLALLTSERTEIKPDCESVELLEAMEETVSRDELISVMRRGIAFHNADLLPDERQIIENAFREGKIRVIFATTTLAMGVNLPAKNVFLHSEKWLSLPGEDRPFLAPLRKSEFVNMGGRAGRMHLNDDFGRAIMLTENLIEREQFRQGIIEEEIEDFTPWLLQTDLDSIVLSILGINAAESVAEIAQFIEQTYSAQVMASKGKELDYSVLAEKSIGKLLEWKLVKPGKNESYQLTTSGEVAVRFGLKAQTGGYFAHLIHDVLQERTEILPASFMMLATAEGLASSANLTSVEMSSHGTYYFNEIKDEMSSIIVDQIQKESGLSEKPWDWIRISKSALLLRDFVEGNGNKELERQYYSYFGAIVRLGEQVAWLLEACAVMVKEEDGNKQLQRRLSQLSTQVRNGIPGSVAFLVEQRIPGLGRERLHSLSRFGVSSWESLAEVEFGDLERMTSKEIADRLQALSQSKSMYNEINSDEEKQASLTMVGTQFNRRSSAEVNGDLIYIRDRDFEVLLRLAVARMEDSEGWVERYKLGLSEGSITQGISRVRETLRGPSGDSDGWIEADGNGHYRLKIEASQIELNHETLAKHWSFSIKKLIAAVA